MHPIAAIDVETTGLDPDRDRIVELGVVVCHPSGRRARRSWLVHPGRAIPESVTRVHGISDATVRRAPPFAAIAAEVLATLGDATPLAYNAPFDRAFLVGELARVGLRVRPAVWIDRRRWRDGCRSLVIDSSTWPPTSARDRESHTVRSPTPRPRSTCSSACALTPRAP